MILKTLLDDLMLVSINSIFTIHAHFIFSSQRDAVKNDLSYPILCTTNLQLWYRQIQTTFGESLSKVRLLKASQTTLAENVQKEIVSKEKNAEVLTRQIGLVGKQTLWASQIACVQNACKWRHIFVCVHRRFSLFMPSHQIHIYLRLLKPPEAVCSRWKLGRRGRRSLVRSLRISLTGLFAILMSVYNVTCCYGVSRACRTYLHGFMWIVPGPSEKER